MIYTIENEHLKVDVSTLGAELQSIFGKKNNFEYLWQGNPEFWKSRATVLFPICGRLCEGKYTYNGKEYEMILHGFAKISEFTVIDKQKDKITLQLKSNEDTLKMYPFNFEFTVSYILNGASVRTQYNVKNTGNEDLPFSVGGHPGFNLPLDKNADFSDHYIEFTTPQKLTSIEIAPSCLYSGKDIPFPLKNDKILPLKHNLFDNDAIFLTGITVNYIELKCQNSDKFIKVTFNDITHLGLWHKPMTEAPYICIEPWHGIPATDAIVDDFKTKKEFIHIANGKEYSTYFDIEVNE